MNATKTTKGYKGIAMEGIIASWYARITLKDIKRHQLMAAALVKHIPAGGKVLEIAPGPGYFCIELAKLGNFQITGLDISQSFVDMCRKNAAAAGIRAEFRQGDAAAMPFPDNSFDFIFCQAAFKNFTRPVQAIAEMYRCLKPGAGGGPAGVGGTAVIADMRRDASPADLDEEVAGMGLRGLDAVFTRWTFRNMLVKSAHTLAEMRAYAAQTPFGTVRIEAHGIGFQAWFEKK